jgi:hypothetical protein
VNVDFKISILQYLFNGTEQQGKAFKKQAVKRIAENKD